MTTSEQLRAQRAKVIEDMRTLNTKAEAENRDLSTEEKESYERMTADVTSLKARYERMESQDALVKELSQTRSIVDPLADRGGLITDPTATSEYRSAFAQYIRTGDARAFRDLNIGTPGDGGYLVPTEVSKTIVTALNRGAVVRKAGARVLQTTAKTVIPVSSQVTGTWEPEADPYGNNADTDPTFTQFLAAPRKYTLRTTISEELRNDGAVDIEAFVADLFTQAYAQAADNAYVNGAGSGSNQPNGVFSGGTDK